ncbi:MAG: PfkB family carbohydrate kinase, partial [Devosiaceae bacterium]|nr:PfkB family carbohydrate kinase [Devosiaceae bacterium]
MLVVGGESLVDLISEVCENNNSLSFVAHAGGSPYNCSIALAKLDNEVGFLCPFSKDNFGDFLLKPLLKSGAIALLEKRVAAPSS